MFREAEVVIHMCIVVYLSLKQISSFVLDSYTKCTVINDILTVQCFSYLSGKYTKTSVKGFLLPKQYSYLKTSIWRNRWFSSWI